VRQACEIACEITGGARRSRRFNVRKQAAVDGSCATGIGTVRHRDRRAPKPAGRRRVEVLQAASRELRTFKPG